MLYNEARKLILEAYGKFLCGLFDVYYRDWVHGDYTSVRLFDDYIHMAMRCV